MATSKHIKLVLLLPVFVIPAAFAAFKADIVIKRPELDLLLKQRTTQQMQAFYEARGFPVDKLSEIGAACFFTIGINNKTGDTLWVDLSRWTARDHEGKELQIRTRSQWKQRWTELGLPAPARSTFNWTVMPDTRDLYPEEHIGSNVTVLRNSRTMKPVTLTARFPRGKDKLGGEVVVKLENVQCPD